MKRTEQATEGLSWGSGGGRSVRGRRRETASEPASGEGRAARRGGSTGAEHKLGPRTEAEGSPARRLRPDRWEGLETRGTGRARPRSGE